MTTATREELRALHEARGALYRAAQALGNAPEVWATISLIEDRIDVAVLDVARAQLEENPR